MGKWQRVMRRAVRIMLFAGAVPLSTPSMAEGLSARTGLAQAVQSSQNWRADAALTRVGTNVLKEDGTATMWQYSFFSPGSVSCARVIILGGLEPRLQDLGECSPASALDADFVDSPEMVRAAIESGFQPGESSDSYLAFTKDKSAPGRECWVVSTIADFDREHGYMRGWCIDAKSGQFVVRLSGQVGN